MAPAPYPLTGKKFIFVSMFDVSSIYGYLGTIKHQPFGDFAEYKRIVLNCEIGFRNALTQCVLEKDGKGTILFLRDFQDLAKTLHAELDYALKEKDRGKVEWLSFQVKKADEAVEYIKRVRKDLMEQSTEHIPTHIATSQPNEKTIDAKVISGTQGLASFLGCGKTKAFEIIKSGVLKTTGIQYQVGRCWKFNAKKLTEYINNNPNFLK